MFKKVLSDLFTSPEGNVSAGKFWLNIAFLVGSIALIIAAVNLTLTVDIFIAYLLTVSGNNLTSKFISMKYSGSAGNEKVKNESGQ